MNGPNRPSRFPQVLALATSVVMVPCVAWAQAQTGGLPDVARRVAALEGTVTVLQSNVTALQTANANLQNALDAEIAARIAGDDTLQAAIVEEATSRLSADFTLQQRIVTETTNRESADQALSNLIASRPKAFATSIARADVPNGDKTVVATLSLPAGKFLAAAKGTVSNREHDVVWGCALHRGSDDAVFDSVITSTETIGATGWIANNVVALTGMVTLTSPGTITMKCQSGDGGSEVNLISLVALEVGS